MKFQDPSIHRLKVANFTEKWKNQSKFQNSAILSKFGVKFSKAPTSIPNIKALAQILLEISCTQAFQILFSKGHNSEKGNNSDMKKNMGQLFFIRNMHKKFQSPSIHRSKVNTHTHTHRHTDRQAESNMPFQLFQSWGHNKHTCSMPLTKQWKSTL